MTLTHHHLWFALRVVNKLINLIMLRDLLPLRHPNTAIEYESWRPQECEYNNESNSDLRV